MVRILLIFELKSGFVIAEVEHTGESNAILELKDEQGNDSGSLSNFIGNGKEKRVVLLNKSGKYFINPMADGHWKVNMSQSIPIDKVVTAQEQLVVTDRCCFCET